MAVEIEFVNVIVRKSAVEARFSGGFDAFVTQDLPNYIEDEHLLRVGFMSTHEADQFAAGLLEAGLGQHEDVSPEVAIVTWKDSSVPRWLTVGEIECRAACWLRDEPPGPLVELDPGLMLRCQNFRSKEQLVELPQSCGVEVRQRVSLDGTESVLLDCHRGEARLEIDVFLDLTNGHPLGIWGRRDLTRRTSIARDCALMRDLGAAIESADAI